MKKIITYCWAKPIPARRWDWCAYFEGEEEGLLGWGYTAAEAVQDLQEQQDGNGS